MVEIMLCYVKFYFTVMELHASDKYLCCRHCCICPYL